MNIPLTFWKCSFPVSHFFASVEHLSQDLQIFGRQFMSNTAGCFLGYPPLLYGAHTTPDHIVVQWG
jgi:hypothetical protein